jgi:cyclic pyranopterin phosphate synthase
LIVDSHHRIHNYLRISLTDACNFRCFYCMPNEEVEVTPYSKLMSKNEIVSLAKTFVKLGVNKIRLTGGEPLIRKDVAEIIEELSLLNVKLTMTTNGVLIHKYIDVLKKANIQSINVSLDTLNAEKFLLLTKRNQFEQVKNNIVLLLQNNFSVKVNVVAMKGINDDEINSFVFWTKDQPIHVRFIEFMPFTANQWHHEKVISYKEILNIVSEKFDFIKLVDDKNDTTKKYKIVGHQGTFAIISTMTAPFCSTCNRIRLTADGKLKNCLFSKTETDLLFALRNNENIEALIHGNFLNKEKELGGQLLSDFTKVDASILENRSMISIGG